MFPKDITKKDDETANWLKSLTSTMTWSHASFSGIFFFLWFLLFQTWSEEKNNSMPISRFLDCQFNRFLFDKTTQLYSDDHLKRTNEQATAYLFIYLKFLFCWDCLFFSPFLIEGFFCRCPTRCVLDKNPSLTSFHQSMKVGDSYLFSLPSFSFSAHSLSLVFYKI